MRCGWGDFGVSLAVCFVALLAGGCAAESSGGEARGVILVVGDGMGTSQRDLIRLATVGLEAARGPKILGLFAGEEMFRQRPEGEGDVYEPSVDVYEPSVSLAEMSRKAMETLSEDAPDLDRRPRDRGTCHTESQRTTGRPERG